MTIATIAVVSMELDGTNPNVSFVGSTEEAYDRAHRICRDLNRDAFVMSVLSRHITSRADWLKEDQFRRLVPPASDASFNEVIVWLRAHQPDDVEIHIYSRRDADPAAGRFWFIKGRKEISVYYDTQGKLGVMPRPYFEIYPNCHGDTQRFFPEEAPEMLEALVLSIDNGQSYN